jgi:hypothetical protein
VPGSLPASRQTGNAARGLAPASQGGAMACALLAGPSFTETGVVATDDFVCRHGCCAPFFLSIDKGFPPFTVSAGAAGPGWSCSTTP